MFKDHLSAVLISIALIVSAVLLRPASANNGPFQITGYDGVVYRLNQKSGRIDVLVPTSEGALMMPIGQISSKEKMTDEERKQFAGFLKTVAQYLQIERAKSLGLKVSTATDAAATGNK